MAPKVCVCGSTSFDSSNDGSLVCTGCGNVLESSNIVSETQFSDAGGIVGTYVNKAKSKSSSSYRSLGRDSRALSLENARRRLDELATSLNIRPHHVDSAHRSFELALENNFTKGRKTQLVAAACLYVVCRREKTPHLLIDFSEVLQINVFMLGRTYLQLCNLLSLKLPIVDPALYIQRFSMQLEFGTRTGEVAATANKLVARMKRDWLSVGRLPTGICGASLYLASKIHGFNRSLKEIIHCVKIGESTVMKRLLEFQRTPASNLRIDELDNLDFEEEMDPPSFLKNREIERKLEEKRKLEEELKEEENDGKSSKMKMKKSNDKDDIKLDKNDVETPKSEPLDMDDVDNNKSNNNNNNNIVKNEPDDQDDDDIKEVLGVLNDHDSLVNASDNNLESIPITLKDSFTSKPFEVQNVDNDKNENNDDESEDSSTKTTTPTTTTTTTSTSTSTAITLKNSQLPSIGDKISEYPNLKSEVDPSVFEPVDNLENFDEEELDLYLESDQSTKVEKEKIWTDLNKEWIEKMAQREKENEEDIKAGRPPRKRKTVSKKTAESSAQAAAEELARRTRNAKLIERLGIQGLNFSGGGESLLSSSSTQQSRGEMPPPAERPNKRQKQPVHHDEDDDDFETTPQKQSSGTKTGQVRKRNQSHYHKLGNRVHRMANRYQANPKVQGTETQQTRYPI
eukprot:gene1533-1929_t